MYKYSKKIGNTESISSWKSKDLSNEIIKPPDNTLVPIVKYAGKRIYVNFNGSFLKRGKTVNIYIFYDLKSNLNNFVPTLFGAVKLTKNSDIDKYKLGIGFDAKEIFHFLVVKLVKI